MNFEVLKRSHIKRNILIGVIVVLILSTIILTFTRAKYRVTESMPLIQGTINFSPYDFNVIAMYLNQEGAMPAGQTKKVPKFGYTLNQEQSTCIVDDTKDARITMNYVTQTNDEKAYVDFTKMSQSGTKCTLYFDLIPDNEMPRVTISIVSDDESVTVTANATDNIGVYYYYYKLDNGEEIRSEDPTYKFEGLTKDETYTISVRVEDAAGNVASAAEEVTVGLKGGGFILASENAPKNSTMDWTGGKSYYYTGNPNNWVEFGGFWWRIIRINGDGSIRIIYQGTSANTTGTETQIGINSFNSRDNNKTYVGLVYDGSNQHGYGTNSTILGVSNSVDTTTLNGWYNTYLKSYEKYIDTGVGFCSDRNMGSGSSWSNSSVQYTTWDRRNGPASLQCSSEDILSKNNGKLTNPIGLVTSDEAILTGITDDIANTGSYLYTGQKYWTMSPCYYPMAQVFTVDSDGRLERSNVYGGIVTYGVRPVINLRADAFLTGSGTTSDPFKVVGAE